MKTNETVKVLRKAKALIKKHGWIKGKIGNKDTGFCALGAVLYAGNGFTYDSTCALLKSILMQWDTSSVTETNDNDITRKRGVLRWFDRAIKVAQNER